MHHLQRPVANLLSVLAACWVIGTSIRCFVLNLSISSALLSKMSLLVVLHMLLSYSTFQEYIITNLETIFNNLPTYIAKIGSSNGNLVDNVLTMSGNTLDKILNLMGDSSFSLSYIAVLICSLFAIVFLLGFTLSIILTSLLATIKFYLILSLSSIWILLFFFQATRNLAMQAINILIGCICQLCLLSAVLCLTNNVLLSMLNNISSGKESSYSSILGIVILCLVNIFLLKEANELAGSISSLGAMSTGGSALRHGTHSIKGAASGAIATKNTAKKGYKYLKNKFSPGKKN